jgi:hypothetical protein
MDHTEALIGFNGVTITWGDWLELVDSVKAPDRTYDLRNVAKAMAAKFGFSAKDATRAVRAIDRRTTISGKEMAQLFGSTITEH